MKNIKDMKKILLIVALFMAGAVIHLSCKIGTLVQNSLYKRFVNIWNRHRTALMSLVTLKISRNLLKERQKWCNTNLLRKRILYLNMIYGAIVLIIYRTV